MADSQGTKEKRLRSISRRAGELEIEAMDSGRRERAVHFMNRMYRMQGELAKLEKKKPESVATDRAN